MKITTQQKSVIAICTGLIIVLSASTFLNRPDFSITDGTNSAELAEQERQDREAYEKYLASIKTDPAASEQLLRQLVKEEDIRADVEADLGVKNRVAIPVISDSSLKISNQTGKSALLKYFSEMLAINQIAEQDASGVSADIFNSDGSAQAVAVAKTKAEKISNQIRGVAVPKEALAFHKANVILLDEYGKVLEEGVNYATASNPNWSEVYASYAVSNAQLPVTQSEMNRLDQKYALGLSNIAVNEVAPSVMGVKTAQAQIGGTTIIADIPRIAERTLRFLLARAFASYTINYMQSVITEIENSYKISNFLYYTDALVQGQYANDYLTKYVADAQSRDLVKQLIPEFTCNNSNPEELKLVFKQKSKEYLGFNPNEIKPDDPDYTEKMLKLGSFFGRSDGYGWELYVQDVAEQTRAEAKNAAVLEQLSPGTKVPRESDKAIAQSLKTIEKGIDKAFDTIFDLGTGNSGEGPASKIVANVMGNIFNKFIFKGAVFKEQKICLDTTVLTPITPADSGGYENPNDN